MSVPMLMMFVLFAVTALAAELTVPRCGNTSETEASVRELGDWSQARARRISANALLPETSIVIRDGIYIIAADDINAPWRHPFDLAGRTLNLTRRSDTAFEIRNDELQYDSAIGPELLLQGGYGSYAEVSLPFAFPFFDSALTKVYVSSDLGIFSQTPATTTIKQYAQLDALTQRGGVIAPLLSSPWSRNGPRPTVHLSTTPTSVTVTWTMVGGVDVQAVLHSNGDIRFSYRQVSPDTLLAGAVIVTSGHEPWRSDVSVLASADDPENDTYNNVPDAEQSMLDITAASIRRVADTDMFQVRVTTRAPMVLSSIPDGETLAVWVFFDSPTASQFVQYTVTPNGDSYKIPGWPATTRTAAARVEGNDVVLTIMRDNLIAGGDAVDMSVYTARNFRGADEVQPMHIRLDRGSHPARADLSAAGGDIIDDAPIAEAFTLAILSPAAVWSQLKQFDSNLRDEDIDGVAIYQNFKTDIVTFAGAYSTSGRSGASGLTPGDAANAAQPRTPNLMHMNKVGFNVNNTDASAAETLMHEFAHRWLFKVGNMENGVVTHSLNPVSAHPAQYVDTRAAFRVVTSSDSSVMGGGFFTETRKGSFSSAPTSYYGYSWLDLYLMGLAGASEVKPFFYIRNSIPALGNEYYPPFGQTFLGTRSDVSVDDVVRATGPRAPSYPDAQRAFKVLFVVVVDPDRATFDEEIADVQRYRHLLEQNFATATNHRGSISTEAPKQAPLPENGPRRRAVRH